MPGGVGNQVGEEGAAEEANRVVVTQGGGMVLEGRGAGVLSLKNPFSYDNQQN